MSECEFTTHMSDAELLNLLCTAKSGKVAWCYPPFCIRNILKNRKRKSKGKALTIFVKNLITLGVRYLLLWLFSNEKNHKESE